MVESQEERDELLLTCQRVSEATSDDASQKRRDSAQIVGQGLAAVGLRLRRGLEGRMGRLSFLHDVSVGAGYYFFTTKTLVWHRALGKNR